MAALTAACAGLAVPRGAGAMDALRVQGATRAVASALVQARLRALLRGRAVALRVESTSAGVTLRMYEDGNANGVLSRDIASGVDGPVDAGLCVEQQWPGTALAVWPGVASPDGGSAVATSTLVDGQLLSFSPAGTATSTTVYVRGRGPRQLAARIYGDTGRIRRLTYLFSGKTWTLD